MKECGLWTVESKMGKCGVQLTFEYLLTYLHTYSLNFIVPNKSVMVKTL